MTLRFKVRWNREPRWRRLLRWLGVIPAPSMPEPLPEYVVEYREHGTNEWQQAGPGGKMTVPPGVRFDVRVRGKS